MNAFSPAQMAGYAALALGIVAFLQRNDKRLKFFSATQSLVYGLHFFLLGNLPASTSALIASARNMLAIRYRSLYLAAAAVVVNLIAGFAFVRSGPGWLPVISSCAASIAMFTMQGISLRCVLLCCTFLWLVNDILSGSIGGTILEVFIASANLYTIIRMMPHEPGLHRQAEPIAAQNHGRPREV